MRIAGSLFFAVAALLAASASGSGASAAPARQHFKVSIPAFWLPFVEALWRLRRLANGGVDLDGLLDEAVAELGTPFCKHRASAAVRHHKHRAESASTSGGFVASRAASSYIDTLMFTCFNAPDGKVPGLLGAGRMGPAGFL